MSNQPTPELQPHSEPVLQPPIEGERKAQLVEHFKSCVDGLDIIGESLDPYQGSAGARSFATLLAMVQGTLTDMLKTFTNTDWASLPYEPKQFLPEQKEPSDA